MYSITKKLIKVTVLTVLHTENYCLKIDHTNFVSLTNFNLLYEVNRLSYLPTQI